MRVGCLFFVFVASLHAALGSCPSSLTTSKWSDLFNNNEANITIALGQAVLLDVPPTYVVNINVFGILVFADTPMELQVGILAVQNGGQLWIGSEDCPVQSQITVTFWGLTLVPKTLPSLVYANKGLAAYGGSQIEIHGSAPLPTWTVITATVNVGATSMSVQDAVSWPVGSSIVIATTDFTKRAGCATCIDTTDPNQVATYYNQSRTNPTDPYSNSFRSEVVTITGISGNTITFSPALEWSHFGEFWQPPDNSDPSAAIDMRAEVGLLTRNLVFRGDITEGTTATDKWGGHIMMTDLCNARIEGAEFYHMGQKDNVARYPVHFHMCQDTSNCYVRYNAFHDTFQRAVTIHESNNILIQDNVGFNVDGHMFFVEDGTEVGNIFRHNLGIQVNPHTLLITADLTPSIFWITSANNTWEDNVAVAGYHCYWFSLPVHPLGLFAGAVYNYWNQWQTIGSFVNNKAHSCTVDGLHIDDGLSTTQGQTAEFSYRPVLWEPFFDESQIVNLYDNTNSWTTDMLVQQFYSIPQTPALIQGFVAYKCIEHAIWCRAEGVWIKGAQLADNQVACQFPGDANIIEDSIIVGETNNAGLPDPDQEAMMQGRDRFYRYNPTQSITGHQFYDNGSPDIVRNTKFYNFVDFHFMFTGQVRQAGAMRPTDGPNVIPPGNKHLNVGFINCPNHVQLALPSTDPDSTYGGNDPNLVSAVVVDYDGSLTGQCGSSIIYQDSPILYTSACLPHPTWNAFVCPDGTPPHRNVRVYDKIGAQFVGSVAEVLGTMSGTIYRLPDLANYTMVSQMKPQYVTGTGTYSTGTYTRSNYQGNFMSYNYYVLRWGSDQTPSLTEIDWIFPQKGEWISFAIPYPAGTTFNFVPSLTMASSLNGLSGSTYYYDSTTNLLWVQMQCLVNSYRYDYGVISRTGQMSLVINATCPGGSCTQSVNLNSAAAPTQVSAIPSFSLCENAPGSVPMGSSVGFTPASGDNPWIFFQGSINSVDWDATHHSWVAPWEISNDFLSNGNPSLKVYMLQQQLAFWRVNAQVNFSASDYTHFQFKIRTAPGRGPWSLGVQFAPNGAPSLTPNVGTVNSPEYCSTCPIDDTQWHQITIPLADLGLGSGPGLFNNIWQFSMWPANWEQINTTFYLADVMFVSGSVTYTAQSLDTSNVNSYNYASDPYTLNPLENLQIPGAPTLPYGSCSPYDSSICNPNNNNWLSGGSPNVPMPSSSNSLSGAVAPSSSTTLLAVLIVFGVLFVVAVVIAVVLALKYKKASELV